MEINALLVKSHFQISFGESIHRTGQKYFIAAFLIVFWNLFPHLFCGFNFINTKNDIEVPWKKFPKETNFEKNAHFKKIICSSIHIYTQKRFLRKYFYSSHLPFSVIYCLFLVALPANEQLIRWVMMAPIATLIGKKHSFILFIY